jgi:hypothetical protein
MIAEMSDRHAEHRRLLRGCRWSGLWRTRRSPLAVGLSLVFTADTVIAEEDLFFADLPIVASVSRRPQMISEAPAAVTVIDREMIRASGMRSVSERKARVEDALHATRAAVEEGIVAVGVAASRAYDEEFVPQPRCVTFATDRRRDQG